jgi:uncharacterized protein (DUF433 family)
MPLCSCNTDPHRGRLDSMDSPHPPFAIVNPEVMQGTPCLAGSRLPAATLIAMVDSGDP